MTQMTQTPQMTTDAFRVTTDDADDTTPQMTTDTADDDRCSPGHHR
jgi:hypothetical protein